MPDEATPTLDIEHQQLIVNTFHFQWKQVEISPIIQQTLTEMKDKLDKMTIANIKARTRMMILYAHANITNYLVCGTSNKSEMLIGYFTKYGDGGVDLQPLGDLYKTQIRQLAQFLKIPGTIINKPPTAGLWRGQTDEKEFGMSYETLDTILYGLEHKMGSKEIKEHVDATLQDIQRIQKMRKHSQHKRRTPLIPKLGARTVGLDWRSPVQEG